MTQEQTKRENMQLLVQVRLTMEQILGTAAHSVTHLLNSSLMERSMNASFTGDDYRLYNELTENLHHLQTFDTGIQDIFIANPQRGWVIHNDGLYRWEDISFGDEYDDYMAAPHDTYWTLRAGSPGLGRSISANAKCGSYIDYVVKLPVNRSEKHGLAVTRIPVCELLRFFPQSEHERMFVLDESLRVIVAAEVSMLGRPIPEVAELEGIRDALQPRGQFISTSDRQRYVLSYDRSSLNGWTYLFMTPTDQFAEQSRRIGWFTLYLCVAILLAAACVVLFVSLRLYEPVRTLLRSIVPDQTDRDMPGRHNEFHWIGQQFQRLHQSKEKLETELTTHWNQSKTYFLLQLFQGDIRPREIEERLHTFGYSETAFRWKQMAVLTIQIDSLDRTRFQESDRPLLLFAVNNIVGELVPERRRLSPTLVEQSQVTLIGDDGEEEESFLERLEQDAKLIQDRVSSFLGLTVSIAISQPFQHFREVPRAYQEGLEALHHRMRLGNGAVIQYNSLLPNQKFVLAYPKRLEDALTDAIRVMDKEKARETLEQLIRDIFAVERHPKEYQIALARLLNQLLIVMQELGVSINNVLKDHLSPYDRLFQIKTVPEIEAWLLQGLVDPIIRTLEERVGAQYHHLSEKMIAMIHNEFDTDISLEKCAEALHYNTSYLSSVFRKETSMSFSEYVSNYRLHMAKKWLTETDMSIKEIAERLQYNNSQNFIRSFRKTEQVTPGQYRSQHRNAP
ncbi:helix-turn-helix domain-containing protein [Paenibacillus sp.]|uniref:helix-turn-helix domain-containing protein n=1 Tax=Paenibacillus sp. TaxID=58172 RepID=UPI002D24A146|nr:helix-turn-helix domain-containing protein [Paenibacillus sp.]HZG86249.1 helix-turn-helix domain-containing protein [Paenibacillus sp.]